MIHIWWYQDQGHIEKKKTKPFSRALVFHKQSLFIQCFFTHYKYNNDVRDKTIHILMMCFKISWR